MVDRSAKVFAKSHDPDTTNRTRGPPLHGLVAVSDCVIALDTPVRNLDTPVGAKHAGLEGNCTSLVFGCSSMLELAGSEGHAGPEMDSLECVCPQSLPCDRSLEGSVRGRFLAANPGHGTMFRLGLYGGRGGSRRRRRRTTLDFICPRESHACSGVIFTYNSGSESNFITERLSQRMKVSRSKVDISVLGIGQAAIKVNQKIVVTIRSRLSEFSRQMGFLVLPKVTADLPTANIDISGWTIPKGIELADPSFCVSSGVDLVLGIESFFDFFDSGRKISLGERLPSLHDSVFGWIISGGFDEGLQGLQINCNVSTSDRLEDLLTRFWSMEEVDSTNYSPEETRCEAIFMSSVQRGADGRYSVALPKDEDVISRLGESKEIAFRRFLGTERRLTRDANLRKQYVTFMEEYLQLGHMRRVEEDQEPTKRCFLPHHPVVKEASTTTKVRVVFDASCKTASGLSLNDALLVGPVIQQDLRSIILRCCTKQIMLVADVEKMFRQIFIHPEDRPFQSILWRSSPVEEIGVYELNTVTYGTKPAPFLATRTLNQLAMDEGDPTRSS
ncbi:uncharacterized protein LOC134285998 [Aedes albopictus]|uniref:Peptidase aspartic putative domain-containing protein n=1 Tax=Aedes albopictus TaxID=7160 RepID=A0ABM1Z306_AEDAL